MTFSRDLLFRVALALTLSFGLTGCEDAEPALTPMEEARAALARGDGVGAEIALRRMIDNGTAPSEIAAYLGEAELQQGDLGEARRWLADAQFSDDTAAHGFHMLGRWAMRQDDLPAAGAAFDRAHAIDPNDADLWVDIARLRFRGGEQAQAIEASKRAVELGPDNPDALRLRAQLVRDAEGLVPALPLFEAALEQRPDDPDLWGEYAATLGDAGRATQMLAAVRTMAKLDGRNPRIFYLQAVLAARAGKSGLARSLLQRAEPAMGRTPAFLQVSGIVDLQNGNYASAAQTFERLISMQPDNRRAPLLLAQALLLGGNTTELLHRFSEQAAQPGASPYLRMTVARALEALGERGRAGELIDRAAAMPGPQIEALDSGIALSVARSRQDGSGRAVVALVRELIAAGDAAAAAREAQALQSRFPGSADAMVLAGDAYRAAGNPRRALQFYRDAAAIRRTWPLVKRAVPAYRTIGEEEAAMRLVRSFAEANRENAEAAVALAQIALEGGNWPRAAELLDIAIARGSERDPAVWAMRAFTARQMRDGTLALHAAHYAYALQPMSREWTGLLASIAGESGDVTTARELAAKHARMAY